MPEKQYEFYHLFKNVINGEQLNDPDAEKTQEYIYPKYQNEIEELIELDLRELLERLQ